MQDYIVFRVYLPDQSSPFYNRPINRNGVLCDASEVRMARTEATALCARANREWGGSYDYQRFELRRVDGKSLEWRDREAQRFAIREYDQTPWHDEPWYQAKHNDHFCHISTKQAGMVAFTQDPAKGEADRQLVMKPGRYLTRYFSDVLSNEQVEQWVAKLSVHLEENSLHTTQDADEIETIYVNGPSSCMKYPTDSFRGHCHPTRVYAGPDLALAYIGPIDDASARCVVWPEQKQFGRIYGDVSRMTLLLEQAGYTKGNFIGARLRRIEDDNRNGLIIPYLDGFEVADNGKHLVVGGEGRYVPSGQTEGVSEEGNRSICPNCDDRYDSEHSGSWVQDRGEEWCDSCCSNHTTHCEHDDNRYSDASNTFVEVNGTVSSWGRRTGVTWTILDDNLDAFDAVYVEDRDEYWKSDETFYCEQTSQHWHNDDAYEWDGTTVSHKGAEQLMDELDDDEAHDSHVRARNAYRYGDALALAA